MGVCGYRYADHANYLMYSAGGKTVTEARNTAMLPDGTNWHEVRLVFDQAGATLSAWVDGTLYLEQTGVNLEGAVFRGLWLRGHGAEYDDISINWTRRAQ